MARLIIVPFTIVTWLFAWAVRFLPHPPEAPLVVRLGTALASVLIFVGGSIGQPVAYYRLSGKVAANDHVFLGAFIAEYVVGSFIIIAGEFQRDRKNRAKEAAKTKNGPSVSGGNFG